ncbi:MAG: hypothetical protein EAZ94_21555 [Oscillatoriales cyanobacterium]|nr:MAG: hypothetical protein EAZ94_21555 [Oscillatoriales cyanobacterium]
MPLTLSVRSNIPDCTAKRSFLILLRALKRNNVPNFKTALPSWAWALFPDIIKSAALKRNYVPNFKTALPSWAWALFPDIIKSAEAQLRT